MTSILPSKKQEELFPFAKKFAFNSESSNFFRSFETKKKSLEFRGGFRGGGQWGTDALFSGIRPPADPKGPPFGTF